jgi:8-amino-7-oxononanoate synthase
VSLVLNDEERALDVSRRLFERRIVAPAIRPPTVPPGRSCIRFSLRWEHTGEQVELLLRELRACIVTS